MKIVSGPPKFGRKNPRPRPARLALTSLAQISAAMLLAVASGAAQENLARTDRGLSLQFPSAQVELAAPTRDALRLSVFYDRDTPPAASSFLVTNGAWEKVAWHKVKQDRLVGIQTKAGRLLIDPETGAWTLLSAGKTLIPLHAIGNLGENSAAGRKEIIVNLGWDQRNPIKVYGCGNDGEELEQTQGNTGVFNGRAAIPYYWSKAGYAVLAVTADDNRPATWRAATDGESVIWTFPGRRADLYLMPAATLKDAGGAYARLTGSAPVPPRWAFGYLQSRWGWQNRAYIENTLKTFHDLDIPVDAFIYDFEWYASKPDYEVPDEGRGDFADFGWNTNLFPDPAAQIKDYKAQGVHFVGIRKPRLGNSDLLRMARTNGWDLRHRQSGNVPARDLDFSNPAVREWYLQQSASLMQAGVDAWWDDEGENSYTTYFQWNLAEQMMMDRYRPGGRLWTLNRSFSPGTQRFGAAAWTGDIVSSWEVFAGTPRNLLDWSLSGMPYNACDIGGFFGSPSPELMCRWMEAGVFFPIMRTHSEVHYQPHFPWLYGTNALAAMRKAIDMRYRLIPYYYSLAHETAETGVGIMRPLVVEFPNDPEVANLSDEWLMGSSLLAAPILQAGGRRSVYLPAGDWYVFGSNQMLEGSRRLSVNAALDEIPVYVRAGTILPLGPLIQHTSEMPGGPLELQIYPGKDATFTLVEDDGESTGYLSGKVRRTTFKWNDAKASLSWQRSGNYSGKDVFQQVRFIVLGPRGQTEAEGILSASGAVKPQVAGRAFQIDSSARLFDQRRP